MPMLKRYAGASSKQGVYIHANVGGDSPVTLQVSGMAERLFQMLDYEPSDTIPSKLVWSMYDVGLLYTLNSLNPDGSSGNTDDATSILDELDLDTSLPSNRKQEIVRRLEEYEGPDAEDVKELIKRLQQSVGETPKSSLQVGDLSLLERWSADQSQFERLIDEVQGFESFAFASFQTFIHHPYLCAPPVWPQDDGSIKYRVEKADKQSDIYIYDYRFRTDFDFKIVIERSEERREIATVSESGAIIEYQNEAGRIGSRINITGIKDWVIPDSQIQEDISLSTEGDHPNEFTHYEGAELEPIREPEQVDTANLFIGRVDRISKSSNRVIELGNNHIVVDQGEPGEKYLIEQTGHQHGRVLSRVVTKRDDPFS